VNRWIWVAWVLACIIGVLFTFLAGIIYCLSIIVCSSIGFGYLILTGHDVSQETTLQLIVSEVIVIGYLLFFIITFIGLTGTISNG